MIAEMVALPVAPQGAGAAAAYRLTEKRYTMTLW